MALCEVAGLSVPPITTTTHSTTLPPASTSADLGPAAKTTGKPPSRITATAADSKPTQPETGSSNMQWGSKTTTETDDQNIQATTPHQPGSPVAIIVPVVLLLVLIIVIIVIVVLKRRRKVRKDAMGNSTTDATTTDHSSATDSTQAVPAVPKSEGGGLVYDDNDNPDSVSADGDELEAAAGAGLSSSSAAGSSDLKSSGATSDRTSGTPIDQQTPGLPPGYELTNEEPIDGSGSLDNIPQISHEDFKQPK